MKEEGGKDQIDGGVTSQMGGGNGQIYLDEDTCPECGDLKQEASYTRITFYLTQIFRSTGAAGNICTGRECRTLAAYIVRRCRLTWSTSFSSIRTSGDPGRNWSG